MKASLQKRDILQPELTFRSDYSICRYIWNFEEYLATFPSFSLKGLFKHHKNNEAINGLITTDPLGIWFRKWPHVLQLGPTSEYLLIKGIPDIG